MSYAFDTLGYAERLPDAGAMFLRIATRLPLRLGGMLAVSVANLAAIIKL